MKNEIKTALFWVEPSFAATSWYNKLQKGIAAGCAEERLSAKMQLQEDPVCPVPADSIIFLAGGTKDWFCKMTEPLVQQDCRVCTVGCTDPTGLASGAVAPGDSTTMEKLVRYLIYAGRRRLALFGICENSPHDRNKQAGFCSAMQQCGLSVTEQDIFSVQTTTEECCNRFVACADRYDGVVCSNDLCALCLLSALQAAGICVPEQLYLTGMGNTLLSRIACPGLTSSTTDLFEVGRQSVCSAFPLLQQKKLLRFQLLVEDQYLARGSTGWFPFSAGQKPFGTGSLPVSSFEDGILSRFSRLESALNQLDATDRQLLPLLLSFHTMEQIAEQSYLSVSTLNYRAAKINQRFGVANRKELQLLLNPLSAVLDYSLLQTLSAQQHG